jgi:translocator assembly and maintenance protein 41
MTKNELRSLIKRNFPPVKFIMAYGSGIFQQVGYNYSCNNNRKRPMIDLILAVNNSKQWHRENLELNRDHYSTLMSICGSSIIEKVQRNFGAQIYYNPFVHLKEDNADESITSASNNNSLYKYGIIEETDLVTDLQQWSTLYVSGRLHKPCLISIESEKDQELRDALQQNLYSALKLSCILLTQKYGNNKKEFSFKELFMVVCSLSYIGDIRMQMGGYGENQNKVANIVNANLDRFYRLYFPIMSTVPFIRLYDNNIEYFELMSEPLKDISDLPSNLLANLKLDKPAGSPIDFEQALVKIVKRTSTSQSLKGILTAGFSKSFMYVIEKMKKGAKAKREEK